MRMKTRAALFFVSIVLPLLSFSLNTDSLARAIKKMKPDTARVSALYNLATSKNMDTAVAIGYVNEIFELAEKLDYTKGMGMAWQARGVISYYALSFKHATIYFNKGAQAYAGAGYLRGSMLCHFWNARCYRRLADYPQYSHSLILLEDYANKLKNEEYLSYAYEGFGNLYRYLGQYPKSIDNYNKSIQLSEKNGRLHDASVALNNLSLVYELLGKKEDEFKLQWRNYQIVQQIADSVNMVLCLSNLSALYQELGKIDSSSFYLDKAVAIIKRKGEENVNFKDVAAVYGQVASLAGFKKDFKTAVEYQNMAIRISQANGDIKTVAGGYGAMADFFSKMGNKSLAEEYYRKSLGINKQIGYLDGQLGAYRLLEELYRSRNDFKKAEECGANYRLLKDSLAILNDSKKLAVAEAMVKIQAQKESLILQQRKRDEEALESNDAKKRQYYIIGGGLLALTAGIIAYRYNRRRRT